MRLVILYADLIGGILGLVGSLILGLPLLTEVKDRRQWEGFSDFLRRHSQMQRSEQKTAEELQAEQDLRDLMLDDRLGGYRRQRKIAVTGFLFLVAAFLFMTLATAMRMIEAAEHSTSATLS
jgi:hypothetical protein